MNDHVKAVIQMKKENPELPDTYGIKIEYFGKEVEEYKIVSHKVRPTDRVLEFVTSDDVYVWRVLDNMKGLTFDKDASRLFAAYEEQETKKEKKKEG